ncbi:MAG: peptide ABC transporter substrate-binding protein [Thiolinea sp.]
MMLKKLLFTTIVALSCCLSTITHAAVLQLHNGGDVASLDPHKISGDWENRVVGDIFEGLVTEDAEAHAIPAGAESWEISEDGMTYTFKLRKDAKWSDGQPVTANDYVFALQRIMNPETAAKYSYLQYPIKNAETINSGDEKDLSKLGAKAVDDHTLEITLEEPTPFFLDALMHFTAYPVPKHVVEAKGDDWIKIDNIVVNGPYKPTEWVSGSHVLTTKNDAYYDVDSLKIEGVKFHTLEDESAALKRYRAGEFDMLTDFPADQYEWIKENLPGHAQVAPFMGVYYYTMNNSHPALKDQRVRQALSMAVNREVIGPSVLGTGELPAYSWVPPGTSNYPGTYKVAWADLPYGEKVAKAKELLKEAGYSADNPLKLQLKYNTNENHKRVAVAIAAMWKELGVEIELFNQEVKVHYADLKKGEAEIARAGWLMDYNDPVNMLDLLRSDIQYNYGRYKNEEYDALLKKAATELDLAKRGELLQQAEKIALDESAVIPIYNYLAKNVVNPKVKGFKNNIKDVHRTRWLSIEE